MERCSEYQKSETYGQFLDGNPCARCDKPEADHLTAWFVPVSAPKEGHLIVYAHQSAEAVTIAGKKGYVADGQIREATQGDEAGKLKVLRPWS